MSGASLSGAESLVDVSAAAARVHRAAVAAAPDAAQDVALGNARHKLTQLVGSLLYMSPEVYSGQPYNDRADVYSLGILLFELVSQTAVSYHEVGNGITA